MQAVHSRWSIKAHLSFLVPKSSWIVEPKSSCSNRCNAVTFGGRKKAVVGILEASEICKALSGVTNFTPES